MAALASTPAAIALPAVPVPANHAPVAMEDRMVLRDFSSSINVLANDSDADGDRLRLVDVTAAHGTVAFTADGLLTYLADPAAGGIDELFYMVADGGGGIAIGTVRLKKD